MRALDPVQDLLLQAGRLAMEYWRTADLVVSDKSHGESASDFVSAADLAVNDLILDGLARLHPGVPVISEEIESTPGEPPPDAFVIDPIDGTHNFLAGSPLWTIALARTRGHDVEDAWIHHPPSGETSRANRRSRTTHAGSPVSVSSVLPRRGLVSVSLTHEVMPLIVGSTSFAGIRAYGSHAYCLAATARGEFVLHAGGGKAWDVAAGFLLVERAGGRVCDLRGAPCSPFDTTRKTLAGAPHVVDTALELLGH